MRTKYNITTAQLAASLQEIGQAMKSERKKQQLTQKELAEMLSVNSQHISRVENGRIGYSIEFYISWCSKLDINPTYFRIFTA